MGDLNGHVVIVNKTYSDFYDRWIRENRVNRDDLHVVLIDLEIVFERVPKTLVY